MNPFQANVPFLAPPPQKKQKQKQKQKTSGFLMFSGVIEKYHLLDVGTWSLIFFNLVMGHNCNSN